MHQNRQESKLKYVDEFLKLECAPSLIALKLFPNAKEITESMAVYTAFRRLLSVQCADFDSSDAYVFVGDGTTPRTAAIFAHLTRAGRCIAIDPMLKPSCAETFAPSDRTRDYKDFLTVKVGDDSVKHPWTSIERVQLLPYRIQQVRLKVKRMVLIMVHCHCSLAEVLESIEHSELVGVVTSPCCKWFKHQEHIENVPPVVCLKDPCMLSSMNDIRIWSSDRAGCLSIMQSMGDQEFTRPSHPLPSALYQFEEVSPPLNAPPQPDPSSAGNVSNTSDNAETRRSVELSDSQIAQLEQEFDRCPHLNRPRDLADFAQQVGAPVQVVRVWFKHQRKLRQVILDKDKGKRRVSATLVDKENINKRINLRAFLRCETEDELSSVTCAECVKNSLSVVEFLSSSVCWQPVESCMHALASALEQVDRLKMKGRSEFYNVDLYKSGYDPDEDDERLIREGMETVRRIRASPNLLLSDPFLRAWTVTGVISSCLYKSKRLPTEMILQDLDEGGGEATSSLKVIFSRRMHEDPDHDFFSRISCYRSPSSPSTLPPLPLPHSISSTSSSSSSLYLLYLLYLFHTLPPLHPPRPLTSHRAGDVVTIQGAPVWQTFLDQPRWCIYGWKVWLIKTRLANTSVFEYSTL